MRRTLSNIITYSLYPFLLISHITIFSLSLSYKLDLKRIYFYVAPAQILLLLTVEFLFPIKEEWKMTRKSFFRDLKYFATGFITRRGAGLLIGYVAIYMSERNAGVLKQFPFIISFIIILLTYEFFQYWFHRISHEAKGTVGRFLWRVHSAHHLPDKVYLLMHPVSHPINFIVTMILLQGVLVFAGVDARTMFLLNVLMGLQGTISHFNVDIRAGFLNYIFIGTELHRFHHSADINEAKNYGAIISIWDIVFRTFYYKPGTSPERLGVWKPEEYPQSNKIFQVLLFPFKPNKREKEEVVESVLVQNS